MKLNYNNLMIGLFFLIITLFLFSRCKKEVPVKICDCSTTYTSHVLFPFANGTSSWVWYVDSVKNSQMECVFNSDYVYTDTNKRYKVNCY